MKKIIQDIWILQNQGLVIFQRVFEEKVNAQLFGGYISALKTFASNINSGQLNNFEMGDKRYVLQEHKGLVFIANCHPKINVKDAQNELHTVINKFFDIYSEEKIKNWDGNLSLFDGFKQKIEDSLEDVLKNFNNAIW